MAAQWRPRLRVGHRWRGHVHWPGGGCRAARLDRPAGIVTFAPPKKPNELLNDWSNDISQMLNLIEGACHLIHKENMIHKIV